MTFKGKTFKDTKEGKEESNFFKARKDPKKPPKGGHTNLIREALNEELQEALEEWLDKSAPVETDDV